MTSTRPIGIVGAGSIGVAFAVAFARAGVRVVVTDALAETLDRGRADLVARFGMLADAGMLDEPPEVPIARVSFVERLADAVAEASLVQECAPERVEVKHEVFAAVAAAAPGDAVLASSSSAIPASAVAEGLDDGVAARMLVGHPGNPPYLLPVIEVVPSARTSPATVERAGAVYRAAGLRPVTVRREVEGFVFNRLQGAVLREAYCLVRDGVIDVDDLDEIVRSGLGRRWSVIGPFETSDLNVRGGIRAHADRMGESYARMGADRGQNDPWTPDLVAEVDRQRRTALPLSAWEDRVRWRDRRLMELTAVWDRPD